MVRCAWMFVFIQSLGLCFVGCGLKSGKENQLIDVSSNLASEIQSNGNQADVKMASGCEGASAGSTEQRLRFEKDAVPFGDSCRQEIQLRVCNGQEWSAWNGTFAAEKCVVEKSLDCVGGTNGTTESRIRFKADAVAFGSQCEQEVQSRTCQSGVWTPWSGSFASGVCIIGEPKECDGARHGAMDTRIRYKASSAGFGGVCQGEPQFRFCNNGEFTEWSGSYVNDACSVQAAADCSYPSTPHGGLTTRIRYKDDAPPFGAQCESEIQVASCFNGQFSSYSGQSSFEKCEAKAPRSCEYRDGSGKLIQTVKHGESVSKTIYSAAEVEFGAQCEFENLTATCHDGSLTFGRSSFAEPQATCVVKKAAPCAAEDGTPVASGTTESTTRYLSATAPFGETCVPEISTRTCSNGVWTPWSGKSSFSQCEVAKPLSCGGVAHGDAESQVRYKQATVPFGELCQAEVQIRTCSNGSFTGWSGQATEVNCAILPPLMCGGTPHDAVQTRIRYAAESVPFGQNCASEVQSRSCFNGEFSQWSGSLNAESCSVLEAASCQGDVASGTTQSRKRYLEPQVDFGQSCADETQIRTCNNGEFTQWSGAYSEEGCSVRAPVSCGSTPHGGFETRTRYAASTANTNGQCLSEIQSRACSNGTFGGWSGQYASESCVELVPHVKSFEYSGTVESFQVPNGVTSLEIKAWGAGGCVFDETPNYAASHTADFGGAGGFSSAVISVQPGEVFSIQVGQGGQKTSSSSGGYPNGGAGYNGGCDGGGSSNVFLGTGTDKPIIIAGGGGGAGWYTPSGAQAQGNGAAGGGLIARSGERNPGAGGTQSEGGQLGNKKGALLVGGNSSGNGGSGGPGAGGGGYFGGASGVGGQGGSNGGGGGGSCFVGFAHDGTILSSNVSFDGSKDYIDPPGKYRLSGGRAYSNAKCLSGNGKNPPSQSDADYLAGTGFGGEKANAKQIPGYSQNWKTAVGGHGRVVIRYALPAHLVSQIVSTKTSPAGTQETSCASDEKFLPGLGCLFNEGDKYLIGVIKQNVINPVQVQGAVRLNDESKVIDDSRWEKIWHAADATAAGNWRLSAQMETSANGWETTAAPAANNIHLMKNANRLPLLKTLAAPVLTAYVYSLFHHETSGDSWTGMDYSGIIYGGPNGYGTFGWYNQAGNPSFFATAYSYASLRMRLWLYPSSVSLAGSSPALPAPRKSEFNHSGSVQSWTAQRAATAEHPIIIKAWGAGGATVSGGAAGGAGAYAELQVTSGVNAGDTLSVYTAGAGQPGSASRSGGGGGGASAVVKGSTVFVVAGGGGGSHAVAGSGYGGAGGGDTGEKGGPDGCAGGEGGAGALGATSGAGGPSNRGYQAGQSGHDGHGGNGGSGNGGATQAGTGGWGWRNGGNSGAVPGDGGGGGGGAGFAGGGGGGGGCWGMGGGGGSSFANSSFGAGRVVSGAKTEAGNQSDADNAGSGAAGVHGRVVIID